MTPLTQSSLPLSRSADVRVVSPGDLGRVDRDRMYQLMDDHFENIDRTQFESDLDEKEWVITVQDAAGTIQGFSTQGLLSTTLDGEEIQAFFTGDTAFAPDYWGDSSWIRAGAKLAISVADQTPDQPLYWLALTSTHRTFRFLPAFWREYYPSPDWETPPIMRRRLEALVRLKFPDEYDPAAGVVRLHKPTPVRPERREMSKAGDDNRYEVFFRERNPGYLEGDFLACILKLSRDNMTRLATRVVNGR